MVMIRKPAHALDTEDIIAEDIYKNRSLIVRKGTKVSDMLIKKFIKWEIETIPILLEVEFEEEIGPNLTPITERKKTFEIISDEVTRKFFYDTLPLVAHENRYGFAMNSEEDLDFIEDTFCTIVKNGFVYNKLQSLMKWDYYSFIHTFDVFILCSLFARHLKMGNVHNIAKAALLYDIGKIYIPKEVLQSKGSLSRAELDKIKMHPTWSYEMLEGRTTDAIRELVLNHHERLDGSGYPNKLKGNQIDIGTRILSIIDVYSALTLERADRFPLTSPKALEILLSSTDQFDQSLIIKFMNYLHIFPLHSVIKLTNNKRATITYIYNNAPYSPQVMENYSKETYYLPNDMSISIKEFVSWDLQDKQQQEWELFINYLQTYDEKRALEKFKELITDKLTDEIYAEIVMTAMKELFDRGYDPTIAEKIFLMWLREKTISISVKRRA
ncbi:HD-GYP domain-containing protein [Bacillus salitolerans]|uniref:HD-GYP domain-containing protein n=1 Tax=Bacillus salitolerans TaxID=1437434 RepID=A0ABW4LNV3_9BACI